MINLAKRSVYISVFVGELSEIQVLSIFDGTIKGHIFTLPIDEAGIKTAVNAVEYCLAGVKFDLTICN